MAFLASTYVEKGTIRHCWPEEKGEEAQYDIAFETVLHDETQLHYKLVRGLDDKDGPKRDNFVHGERVKARARTAAGNVGDHYFEGVIATTTSSRNLASGNDLDIDYVHTCNYEGKKKKFTNRRTKKVTFFRRPDFKKAFVTFKVRPARRRAPPRARSSERA